MSDSKLLSGFQTIGTFVLVSFAWVFFRADNMAQVGEVLRGAFGSGRGNVAKLGLHGFTEFRPFMLAAFCVILFSAAESWKTERRSETLTVLSEKVFGFWISVALLTAFVAIFGIYGGGYNASAFIYFQF